MNSFLFIFLLLSMSIETCYVCASPVFINVINASSVSATVLPSAEDFKRENINFQSTDEGRDWYEVSVEARKHYRFTISIPLDYYIYSNNGIKVLDSVSDAVFLVTNSTACAEDVRCLYGSEFTQLDSRAAAFSKDSFNTKSKAWEQLISYSGNVSNISLRIIWNFADEKTVYERFESAKKSGESILWAIEKVSDSDEVNIFAGFWYFSSDDSDRSICSSNDKLSHDDGLLGASGSANGGNGVDGAKSPVLNDFWGHGNANSEDSQCKYWYEDGIATVRENAVSWLKVPKRATFCFSPPDAGNYFVSLDNQEMIDYTIRFDEIVDDYSSDNETESVLELDVVTKGKIDFKNDMDWHSINLEHNVPYICKVEGIGVFIKSFRESNGNEISVLDERKIEQNAFFGIETAPEIYFLVPTFGYLFC